ncbi:amino acid ABC transporter substrate-binding protein [Acidaminobacter sp. JC074]|uniref:amino acid ABC transporter substrate-binding protein n=1 Tax=Acidaminobacter sp. JC074 TaxID=2530199 RepID=UPI001F1043F0|nr:amino acid ABC transporter substrate-binding protein [Acidaminobacter sp. JC074]MCH4886720.1 amino acid ABC transporter substrate-binding protein [Acidaminobacter sp. JC074]
MKKIGLGVLLVILVAVSVMIGTNIGGNEKENDKIVVGMSGGYKPYTYSDEKGNLVGFEVDTWNEIGKRIGREVEFMTADFSGLFGLLDSGKIHTISNQITVNDKRKEKYIFSEPYVYYGAQLVVRSDNNDILDLESLKGKSVGVSLGSNYEEMIKKFDVKNEIDVITYESYQGSLQDVSLGRIDAVLNDKLAGLTAIEESGLDLKLGGEPIEMLFNAFPFVQSQDAVLIEQVNEAINAMYADGTFEEIALRWFPVNITEK